MGLWIVSLENNVLHQKYTVIHNVSQDGPGKHFYVQEKNE